MPMLADVADTVIGRRPKICALTVVACVRPLAANRFRSARIVQRFDTSGQGAWNDLAYCLDVCQMTFHPSHASRGCTSVRRVSERNPHDGGHD
jgi:hypothetical protein